MATNIVNIKEAETRLAQVIEKVLAGEEVVIAEAGKPLVKIIRYVQNDEPRRPGFWKGKVKMTEDFDELPDELLRALPQEIST
jgi:antitoxin (DNA-binding transcriptional repressor) of toxin-antitoxin stability system